MKTTGMGGKWLLILSRGQDKFEEPQTPFASVNKQIHSYIKHNPQIHTAYGLLGYQHFFPGAMVNKQRPLLSLPLFPGQSSVDPPFSPPPLTSPAKLHIAASLTRTIQPFIGERHVLALGVSGCLRTMKVSFVFLFPPSPLFLPVEKWSPGPRGASEETQRAL